MFVAVDTAKKGNALGKMMIDFLRQVGGASRALVIYSVENPDKHFDGEEIVFFSEFTEPCEAAPEFRQAVIEFLQDVQMHEEV